MKSFFNPADNDELITRINKLNPDTKPEWGKMKASQMLAHCQVPLKVAIGESKLKRGLMGLLFGKIAKKQLMKAEDFKRNLPTAPSFVVKDERVFEDEKNNLISLVKKVKDKGVASLTVNPHPFFGKLTENEWDTLQWKHLDHHLRQFGV
jgi:hypothetical protein